jgi:hypothetical protein
VLTKFCYFIEPLHQQSNFRKKKKNNWYLFSEGVGEREQERGKELCEFKELQVYKGKSRIKQRLGCH